MRRFTFKEVDVPSLLWEMIGVITLAIITQWVSHSNSITAHIVSCFVLLRAILYWPAMAAGDRIARWLRPWQGLRVTASHTAQCDDHTVSDAMVAQCDDVDVECDKSAKLSNNINISLRASLSGSGTIISSSPERMKEALLTPPRLQRWYQDRKYTRPLGALCADTVILSESDDHFICPECASHNTYIDCAGKYKGFYVCQDCGAVWGNGEEDASDYTSMCAPMATVEEMQRDLYKKLDVMDHLIDAQLNSKDSLEDKIVTVIQCGQKAGIYPVWDAKDDEDATNLLH